ncbi:YopX family protein [Paenibacillus graminis]|uniref:YopX family protein n=1 Tax=Paenibacillus graminis TaxID=189425 RepID=UPI002DB570AB|nr:YopX family protein [Paenibacillus graminis]MEC0171676.1 YopX family protein [Paenibacillus graminis]
MGREIKFRVWDKALERFSFPDFLALNMLGEIVEVYDNFRGVEDGTPNKEVVLSQYTGRKDRNDEEIYEGDIMRAYNDFGDVFSQLTVVRFDQEKMEWKGVDWSDLKNEEVIGNIYENPELLEV